MPYDASAANRFGFNTQQTIYDNARATNVPLSANGSQNVLLNATANIKVQLPDPTLCLDQTRTITNRASGFTVEVVQYNATAFSGLPIGLPGVAAGTLQAGTSTFTLASGTPNTLATATPKYSSATYYCNGSTWVLQSATANPIFT
jgi:hypothetical protein